MEEVEDEGRHVSEGCQMRLGRCVAFQLGFESCICVFGLCRERANLRLHTMQMNSGIRRCVHCFVFTVCLSPLHMGKSPVQMTEVGLASIPLMWAVCTLTCFQVCIVEVTLSVKLQ